MGKFMFKPALRSRPGCFYCPECPPDSLGVSRALSPTPLLNPFSLSLL